MIIQHLRLESFLYESERKKKIFGKFPMGVDSVQLSTKGIIYDMKNEFKITYLHFNSTDVVQVGKKCIE